MRCSKVLIVLVSGLFTLAAVGANSITVRQTGNYRVAFEVEYMHHPGQKHHEFSGYFSQGEQKTIDMPSSAFEIHLNVCTTWENRCKDRIFTKFYNKPVTKCFTLSAANQFTDDTDCQPLIPAGGYSISVHQAGAYESVFEVTYVENSQKLTKSSGNVAKGKNETIQIPDRATDITFKLYRVKILSKELIVEKSYRSPVKKCFEADGDGFFSKRWLEKPCQKLPALNGNFVSVDQTLDYKVVLQVVYDYDGSELTESSGTFGKGVKKTISIPDKATNIRVMIYKEGVLDKLENILTHPYPSPTRKCYKPEGFSTLRPKWSVASC